MNKKQVPAYAMIDKKSEFQGNNIKEVQVEKMINRGAFSYIFSGRLSYYENLPVIVKLFKNKKDNDWKVLQNFYQEVMNLKQCIHENIVKSYGVAYFFSKCQYKLGIIMEKFELNLKETILMNISLREKFNLTYQLLKAIEYLHKHNRIHGDLKPQNIIICDLGSLHKIKEEPLPTAQRKKYTRKRSSTINQFAFTPAYAPPEYLLDCLKKQKKKQQSNLNIQQLSQLSLGKKKNQKNEQQKETANDIWALGLIMYDIFFKKAPSEIIP